MAMEKAAERMVAREQHGDGDGADDARHVRPILCCCQTSTGPSAPDTLALNAESLFRLMPNSASSAGTSR
jgi:hypothetical protein